MKDMPAVLAAYLTVADPDLAVPVFGRVIDNGRMLRNFVADHAVGAGRADVARDAAEAAGPALAGAGVDCRS